MNAIFLQARLNSSRLPNKALLPLAGMTVIEHAMASLIKVKTDLHVLLTDKESQLKLYPLAEKWGFKLFTGPREDVLLRFALAAELYKPDRILRATGDNPLVSAELAEDILSLHKDKRADCSGFTNIPLGTGVEVIETNALFTAEREAVKPYDREHVTPFLYAQQNRFTIYHPQPPSKDILTDVRVSIDTKEDYIFILKIFEEIYSEKPIQTSKLVEWLKKRNRAGQC